MRFDSFTALLAVSNALLGVSAGPLAAKRQDASSSVTATSAATSTAAQADETSSTTSGLPSVALVVTTMSDGKPTTFEVFGPQPTGSDATTTEDSSATATATTTYTFSRTGQPVPISTEFPACHDTSARPFCLPTNGSTLYVGKPYYVTWNPDFFPINSTVVVKVQWSDNSGVEAWSSGATQNQLGHTAITMNKDWLQGYSMYNLTFRAVNYENGDPSKQAEAFDGPMITLQYEPPHHLPSSKSSSINKEGLLIGLPVGLGFVLVVVVGLFIGMRKNRIIGVGNIMGRKRGYGAGKSRRQRLGLSKKGAIRLEDREVRPDYSDTRGHARDNSLGSLVSDDGIRPAPAQNHFRDEMQRQRTGR